MCICNGGAVRWGWGLAGMEEDNRFRAPGSGLRGGDRGAQKARGGEGARRWVDLSLVGRGGKEARSQSHAETWSLRHRGDREQGACGDSWGGGGGIRQGEERPRALGQLGHPLGARKRPQGSLRAASLEIGREDSPRGGLCANQGAARAPWQQVACLGPTRHLKVYHSSGCTEEFAINGSTDI